MKKVVIAVVVLALIGIGFWFSRPTDQPTSGKPVVKIGVVLPLTGNASIFGQSYKNGLIMAEKHLPKDTKYSYKLIIEDTAWNTKSVPLLGSKLLNVDKVDAGLSIFTPEAMILSPMFSNVKRVHIASLSWFPDEFLKDKYNFHAYANMEQEANLVASYIAKKNYKNVVMFTLNMEGAYDGHRLVKAAMKEKKLELCQEIVFNAGQRDFKMDILKMENNCHPDLYILGALPPESEILLKLIREVNPKADVTGLDLGMVFSSYKQAEGFVFPMMALPDKEWLSEYDDLFHDDLYVYASGIAYDSFNILVDAFENTPTQNIIPTSDQISDYIHRKRAFDSVFGAVNIAQNGQIDVPISYLTVKNGQFETVVEE